MTSLFASITGVFLYVFLTVAVFDGQCSDARREGDVSGGDGGGGGGALSLKQTILSADKIVKSLETDEKISRAVQNATGGDKRVNSRENLTIDDEEDDEEEEEMAPAAEGVEEDTGKEKERREDKSNKGPKIWDQWSKWSACSVTCGLGKITRWRHCVSGGCAPGEKEAQIKTCTLPSC